jgi:hypothetical protein
MFASVGMMSVVSAECSMVVPLAPGRQNRMGTRLS